MFEPMTRSITGTWVLVDAIAPSSEGVICTGPLLPKRASCAAVSAVNGGSGGRGAIFVASRCLNSFL